MGVVLWAAWPAARPALAYDFEITARTEAYGYQLRRFDRGGLTFINRRRFTQHLGLRVFNLLDPGDRPYVVRGGRRRPPQRLYLTAMMRFFSDFGGYVRPLFEWPELRNDRFELLVGSLEGRDILGYIDFSVGRQFDAELMDFFGYDGVRLRINSPWKLFAEAHFGIEVDRARPFSTAVFEGDGVSADAADDAVAPTFGVAVGIEDLHHLDLRLAYRGVASRATVPLDEGLARAEVPDKLDLWGIDRELIFVSAAYRIPEAGTSLLFGVRRNLLLGNFDEIQGSAVQALGRRQRIQAEFLRSRPHFDGDSIFNVFGVEPFNEIAGRYTLRATAALTLEGRFGYRWFWAADAENEGQVGPAAVSTGLLGRYEGRRLSAGAEAYLLWGLEGWRGGGDTDARWRLGRLLALDGRVSLIANRDETPSEGPVITTLGLQLGATVFFTRGVQLHLMLEDNISRLYRSALRVFAMLDLELAIR